MLDQILKEHLPQAGQPPVQILKEHRPQVGQPPVWVVHRRTTADQNTAASRL